MSEHHERRGEGLGKVGNKRVYTVFKHTLGIFFFFFFLTWLKIKKAEKRRPVYGDERGTGKRSANAVSVPTGFGLTRACLEENVNVAFGREMPLPREGPS